MWWSSTTSCWKPIPCTLKYSFGLNSVFTPSGFFDPETHKLWVCRYNDFSLPIEPQPSWSSRKGYLWGIWLVESGRPDLNRRPHGPEPCTLAGLSYAPNVEIIIQRYSLCKVREILGLLLSGVRKIFNEIKMSGIGYSFVDVGRCVLDSRG